jgi:tol-pal system protein YbgF
MRFRLPIAAPLALALAAAAGCARTAEERQLDAMRADIDRIRDDRDHTDEPSLGAEGPGAAGPPAKPAPPPQAPPPAAPGVRVGDDVDGDDYADPDDTAPRPRIRVFGTPRVSGKDVEQVDDGTDPAGRPSHSSVIDPQAKRAYDAAMGLVTAQKYEQALDAFAAFLVKWPDHPYADHAMYWRGECYFARGDFARAADQFEGVLARFPAGAKAPDALLKLGMSHQKLGNLPRARECFARLARDFPQTDAARHIPPDSQP